MPGAESHLCRHAADKNDALQLSDWLRAQESKIAISLARIWLAGQGEPLMDHENDLFEYQQRDRELGVIETMSIEICERFPVAMLAL